MSEQTLGSSKSEQSRSRRLWGVIIVFIALVIANVQMFAIWSLGDFETTFYHSANYLLRGENVYQSPYPHPTNGQEYPPFNPIWIVYAVVPLSTFPLKIAEVMRFSIDLAAIPFLAYLSARWAGLKRRWVIVLIALAPWHFIVLYSGQWTVAAFLGTLLCYWGVRRRSSLVIAVGLWLVLMKFHIALLIILATLIFSWRNGTLARVVAILTSIILIFSLPQPTWVYDLLKLYIDRLQHPRLTDSVLLLPGYPWAQIVILTVGALFLIAYVWIFKEPKPEPWLWSLLIGLSLVGALHTFTYDWMMLMLPIAWLLRYRYAVFLIGALYVYPFIWAVLSPVREYTVPFAVTYPTVLLMGLIWLILFFPYLSSLYHRHVLLLAVVANVSLLMLLLGAIAIGVLVPTPVMIPAIILMATIVYFCFGSRMQLFIAA